VAGFAYATDVGSPSYQEIESFARGSGVGFSVSSTTGGSHANGSYHYSGNAEDLVSSAGSMQTLAAWLYGYYPYILELIHSGGPGYFVKNGEKVSASYYGASTVSQHYNHVHIAMTLSGIAAARGQANAGATTVQPVASPASIQGPPCLPTLILGGGILIGVVDLAGHIFGWL
jgi:hypothetical protein